ncbi:venom metalloproteinase antarease TserMP_A-like [Tachypleus tridentatus]|uniref:venom metalloproteinase antarease TserMP_A-like n=1 Tax=Tachypleus tridentatus TaxID=6853 RepID=UPI003FD1B1C1
MSRLEILTLTVILFWSYVLAEHETVNLQLTSLRDGTGTKQVQFSAYGKKFNLNLRPAGGPFSEDFTFQRNEVGPDGKQFSTIFQPNLEKISTNMFVDYDTGTSVHLEQINGRMHMEGILTNDLRITPETNVRSSFAHRVFRVEMKQTHVGDEVIPPIITTQNGQQSFGYNDEVFPPINSTRSESSRQAGGVTVELLAVSDYAHQSKFNSDKDLIKYMGLLYNAVNLHFTTSVDPKVTVLLTSIIRNTDPSVEPYITSNLRSGYLLADSTLNAFSKYLPVHANKKYDAALLTTGRDMAGVSGSELQRNVAGLAYVGAACNSFYRHGEAEDTPMMYDGALSLAHELAHILGAVHDGESPAASLSGSPGAVACPWSDGYIMSYINKNNNHNRFSTCSQAQFKFYQSLPEARCLQSTYQTKVYPDPSLPGQDSSLSLDTLCQLYHSDIKRIKSYTPSNTQPCKFYCSNPPDKYGMFWYYTHDALEGSSCGSGKACIFGECINYP